MYIYIYLYIYIYIYIPLLRIVVPEQHLPFCYLLESQKSCSEKVNCCGNAERWSLKHSQSISRGNTWRGALFIKLLEMANAQD